MLALRESEIYEVCDSGVRQEKTKSSSGFNGFVSHKDAVCKLCGNGSHWLSKCDAYQDLDAKARYSRVSEMKLCFSCLNGNHLLKDCKSKYRCFVNACGKKHHSSLHQYYVGRGGERFADKKDVQRKDGESDKFNGVVGRKDNKVYLQIVPVSLKGASGKMVKTYALLDGGSSNVGAKRSRRRAKVGWRGAVY